MKNKLKVVTAAVSLICLGFASSAVMAKGRPDKGCSFDMVPVSDSISGTARVTIAGDNLRVKLKGTLPGTLYTVWVTFSGSPDRPAGAAGSAPAFATTAPVYNGMRTDKNGFFTDYEGDGMLDNDLGYDLLATGAAPVTIGHNMQGLNRVGRDWMRVFEKDKDLEASIQVVDENGTPLVERATATGLAVVSHPDTTTHGGSPGVGGVDQNGAFRGVLADCN